MLVDAAPNIERQGVVGGFVMSPNGGSVALTKGVLFAQGTIYRPAGAPSVPAPPAGQGWLFYNALSGFYWASAPTPVDPTDAFLGWALTVGGTVVAVSAQKIVIPDPKDTIAVIPLGSVVPPGSGLTSFGDTAIPPQPSFGLDTRKRGRLEFLGIGWPTLENTRSITTGTFKVLYVDETAGAASTLTADVDAATQTFPVSNGASFTIGELYMIDRELVKVQAIDGNNLTVDRGQFLSVAAAHAGPKNITAATNATPIVVTAAGHLRAVNDVVQISGANGNTAANGGWEVGNPTANTLELVGSSGNGAWTSGGTIAGAALYRVKEQIQSFSFEPEFFSDSLIAPDWRGSIDLPNARVCTGEAWFTNALGDSPSRIYDMLQTTMRTLLGGQVDLEVEGTLGIQSDAVPAFTMPAAAAVEWVFAEVKTAPTGAAIRVTVKKNGAAWANLVIAAGQTSAVAAVSGRALGPLAAGDKLTLDITAVGTTFPGERLVVTVRL